MERRHGLNTPFFAPFLASFFAPFLASLFGDCLCSNGRHAHIRALRHGGMQCGVGVEELNEVLSNFVHLAATGSAAAAAVTTSFVA